MGRKRLSNLSSNIENTDKQTSKTNKTFLELDSSLSRIFNDGSIISKNNFSKIDDYIPTGNYILNAQISGSLFGGIPNTRTICIAGESGCLYRNEYVRIYEIRHAKLPYNRNLYIEGYNYDNNPNGLKIYEMFKPDKKFILKELDCFENEYDLESIKKIRSPKKLMNIWNKHLEKKSVLIRIIDVINKYVDKYILIDTPDGYLEVGDFYIKSERMIYNFVFNNNDGIVVSHDHYFEVKDNIFKKASELKIGDDLISKNGKLKIVGINILGADKVYDLEVRSPKNRYYAGESSISSHNTGKTFLSLNICREAQQKGYNIVYCDSEAAIDYSIIEKFGINPDTFRYQPVSTVQEFSTFVNNLLELLKKYDDENKPKILLVLDSLGNLASSKEKEDAVKGAGVRDMTKQQMIRSMFRTITVDLARHKIPFLFTNHTYQSMGYIPTKEISGGGGVLFNPSIILMLSKAKLQEEIDDAKNNEMKQTGIIVTSHVVKNRFAKPIPVKFYISFFKGMNKYIGLEKYINWENCGIQRGKLLTDIEFDKLSEEYKENYDYDKYSWVVNNDEGNVRYYFIPNDNSRKLVVKHLCKEIEIKKLFSSEVLNEDVLRELDERVINGLFSLPDGGILNDNEIDDFLSGDNKDSGDSGDGGDGGDEN